MSETTETKELTEVQQREAIVKQQLEAYLGEPIEETPAEEVKVEEKQAEPTPPPAEEPSKEEPTPPPIEEPKKETPPFDVEALKADMMKDIQDKYNLTPKEAESMWQWQRENRNPKSYEELAENIKEAAVKDIEAKLQAQEEARRAEEEKAQAEEKQRQDEQARIQDEWNKKITEAVVALRKSGKLEDSDEAERNFWEQVGAKNKTLSAEGKPIITDVNQFYLFHYEKPTKKELAGANAPIVGPNSNAKPKNEDSYSYAEVHGSSFYDIVSGKK